MLNSTSKARFTSWTTARLREEIRKGDDVYTFEELTYMTFVLSDRMSVRTADEHARVTRERIAAKVDYERLTEQDALAYEKRWEWLKRKVLRIEAIERKKRLSKNPFSGLLAARCLYSGKKWEIKSIYFREGRGKLQVSLTEWEGSESRKGIALSEIYMLSPRNDKLQVRALRWEREQREIKYKKEKV